MTGASPAGPTRAGVEPVRSRETFAALRRPTGRGRHGPVSVSFVARPSWDRREVAYAIDRKVGTAVQRNLLRRRLRAIVAERADQLPTGAYLVRSGPEGTGFEFLELKVAMSRAMQKATKRVPEGVGQDRRASVGAGR